MADPAELKISSTMTPLMKFVHPIVWLGLTSYFICLALMGSPKLRWGAGVNPVWGKALLFSLLLAGLWFTYSVSIPLKKMWLTANGVRVSNYLYASSIEWSQVRCLVIRGTYGHRSTPLVQFELWQPQPFRGRIVLLPASEHLLAELTAQAVAFRVTLEQRDA